LQNCGNSGDKNCHITGVVLSERFLYFKEKVMERRKFLFASTIGAASLLTLAGCGTVSTASTTTDSAPVQRRRKINSDANSALDRLYTRVPGSREVVGKARGALIFPSVIAAGLGVGGEYGEGVLRVGNSTEAYYNLASVSVGLQIGAQSKAIIFLFMTQDSLDKFRNSKGWSVGVDASVALIRVGANGELDVNSVTGPVVAFVMTNAGLMANLTLEGTKITRLET
jgi:lipid-binding SYLF domain-containing protein